MEGSRLQRCHNYLAQPAHVREYFRGSATVIPPIQFNPAPLKSRLSDIYFSNTKNTKKRSRPKPKVNIRKNVHPRKKRRKPQINFR